MKKTHVENNDVQSLARNGRVGVNADKKMLRVSKNAVIGIKTWGIKSTIFASRKTSEHKSNNKQERI